MQTAALSDQLVRGTQVQVVSIAQLNLATNILQVFCAERTLDGALGANVHKDRSLNCSVGASKFTTAGLSFCFE